MGAYLIPIGGKGADKEEEIMTVTGSIHPSELKFTLSHEHILVDFIGADKVSKDRYHGEEVFNTALPFLQDVKAKGCNTFVDCTPAYLGRDAQLLQRLAKATGLHIITNTGYYGARNGKFLPQHVHTETAEQIADRWINEWKNGIDGTGIKPGFIKTGVDNAPLTAPQRKIIDAAALTHLASGLTIGVHTGDGGAAEEQLDILSKRGVLPSARIWIHAQNETDKTSHIKAAQRGSWVSFDGVSRDTIQMNIEYLKAMKAAGLLNFVLVSQDSGWYNVGEAKGGNYKNYNFIHTDFIPALKQNGFLQSEIDAVFISNPARAFAIRVRKR
jgi:phosphotriesterase-related protein